MTSRSAIIALMNGKKIRREMWEDYNYWQLKDNKLVNQQNIVFNMTFNELMMNDDWELYEVKLNFYEAIDKMKMGFKVKFLENDTIYYIDNGQFKDYKGNDVELPHCNFDLKNWELVDE